MRNIFFICSLLVILAACSDAPTGGGVDNQTVPKSDIEARKIKNGSLTGDDGGLTLLGTSRKTEEQTAGSPIAVNSYLWRATLDTLSFMPLVSADPFGGVIITDWYEDPKNPGERFKVNAIILDKSLRADGVKLTVFRQTQTKNVWRDQKVDAQLARSLEDTILTRARQLRVAQLGK